MATKEREPTGELRISPEQLLVMRDEEAADDYGDNYVRRVSGPILQEYRGHHYSNRVVRKIVETTGYHRGAALRIRAKPVPDRLFELTRRSGIAFVHRDLRFLVSYHGPSPTTTGARMTDRMSRTDRRSSL